MWLGENPLRRRQKRWICSNICCVYVGRVVAKPALDNALYSLRDEVTPNALEALISRLRKRLGAAAADIQIRTVHGVGYALFEPR